jgi:CheY-like chemotaxis protein
VEITAESTDDGPRDSGPAVTPAAAASHHQLSRPGADGREPAPRAAATPRIIVADDDISIRTIVRRVLTAELRAEVVEVTDGLGVLEVLQTSEFDLAILDIEMNVLDGLDTLEAIRTASCFRNLPVIVISGRVDETNLSRLKSWHVQGLLAKPLTMTVISERLLPLVRQILEPPPVTTATPPVGRLALRPSSRVFVVSSDEEYSRVLHAELHGCCALTFHRDESAALRAASTKPPDLTFLAIDQPFLSGPGENSWVDTRTIGRPHESAASVTGIHVAFNTPNLDPDTARENGTTP